MIKIIYRFPMLRRKKIVFFFQDKLSRYVSWSRRSKNCGYATEWPCYDGSATGPVCPVNKRSPCANVRWWCTCWRSKTWGTSHHPATSAPDLKHHLNAHLHGGSGSRGSWAPRTWPGDPEPSPRPLPRRRVGPRVPETNRAKHMTPGRHSCPDLIT